MTEPWQKIDRWVSGFLALTVGACFALFAAVRPLVDWDEGLYANIVGEIVRTGNWLHLTLQGAAWFDKEPFGFWLMAVAVKIFGWHVWALRLPALLAVTTAVPIFYWLLRTYVSRIIAVTVSVLLWSAPIMWFSHMLGTADLEALTLLFSVAIPAAYVRWPNRVGPTAILWGLFLLTRGVWAVPFLGFLMVGEAVHWWQTKQTRRLLNFVGVIALACLPWLIWHGLQYQSNPAEYVRVYWHEQFLERISGQVDGHGGGTLFYVDFLKNQLGAGYAIMLMLSGLYLVLATRYPKQWLWAVWLLVTIVPPHIITTKLSWYSLPALPALFAALGITAQTILQKKYLSPKLVGLIAAVLLVSGLTRTNVVYRYFAQADRQIDAIVATLAPLLPAQQPVIMYGVRNWTFGRVLPATYWLVHSVHQWTVFSVDAKSAEYYVTQPQAYQWWWTTTSTLAELKHTPFTGCVVTTTVDYVLLTTVTTSPHCVSSR